MKAEQQIANEFAKYRQAAEAELEGLRARVQELEITAGIKEFVPPDPSAQPVQPPPPVVPSDGDDADAPEAPEAPDFTFPGDVPPDLPPIAGVTVPISVEGEE